MIKPADIEFHTPPDADHNHAETNYFALTIPDERLMVSVYTLTRKALGVMLADVIVYGDLVDDRAQCLYIDSRQHLPAPARLSDYTTANGLAVKALNPRDYRIDYVGYDETEIHVDFRGLMEPFDIHDPAHSPKAAATATAQHAGSGLGAGYGGHFDLTGRITGTFKLRGREYPVDCVETMDHSWGRRPEFEVNGMGWMHAHFGPDFALHWINTWALDKPAAEAQALAHGYVMENGIAYGLTDLKLRTTRVGSTISAMEVEATDRRGRSFHMHGSAVVGAPWLCYTCVTLYAAMMRWQLDDGRIGYGMVQENQSVQAQTRHYGRRWSAASR